MGVEEEAQKQEELVCIGVFVLPTYFLGHV